MNKIQDILLRIHSYQIFVPAKVQGEYIAERLSKVFADLYEDSLNPAIVDYSYETLRNAETALSEIRSTYAKYTKRAEKKLLSDIPSSNIVKLSKFTRGTASRVSAHW